MSRWRSVRRLRPSRRDVVIAGLVTLVEVLGIRSGPPVPEPSVAVGLLALLLSLAQGVPLLWRRHLTVPVLLLVTAAFVAHAWVLAPVPPYGAWVALVTVALRRDVRATAVATASVAVAVVAAYLPTMLDADGAPATRDDVILPLLVTVAVALTAQLVRERRARTVAMAERSAAEERLRIARDLHDVLGHSLSGIAVQSSSGRLALDAGQPDAARQALAAIEDASRSSMREVASVLGILRRQDEPGLDAIEGLVAQRTEEGVDVSLHQEGDTDGVPPGIGRTAYRVVQEALTNVTRHAGPCRVAVTVRQVGDLLEVSVADDGRGTGHADGGSGGHGLVGMRERVTAVGGRLSTGPRPDGGWLVHVELPVTGTAAS